VTAKSYLPTPILPAAYFDVTGFLSRCDNWIIGEVCSAISRRYGQFIRIVNYLQTPENGFDKSWSFAKVLEFPNGSDPLRFMLYGHFTRVISIKNKQPRSLYVDQGVGTGFGSIRSASRYSDLPIDETQASESDCNANNRCVKIGTIQSIGRTSLIVCSFLELVGSSIRHPLQIAFGDFMA